MTVPKVNLVTLLALHRAMIAQGIEYGLGAKAPSLDCHPEDIHTIDCSGDVRYLLDHATNGALVLPDGSQNMRDWCERLAALGLLHEVKNYSDLGKYTTSKRLFICFIKPNENGAGDVGHVWLVMLIDGRVKTIESHGGKGCDSRLYNVPVLNREEYSAYELPTVQGAN